MSYDYSGLGAVDEVQRRTDQLAEAVALSMDPSKGAKYQQALAAASWFPGQVQAGMDMLARTRAGQVIRTTGDAAADLSTVVESAVAGNYTADASGIYNIAKDVTKFVQSLGKALIAAGVSESTVKEINDWTAVAGTCTGGIAVAGVWGIAACGLSALVKVLDIVLPKSIFLEQWSTPRSIFVAEDYKTKAVIMADSIRLAQMLRHHYGFESYAPLAAMMQGEGETSNEFSYIERDYPVLPGSADGRGILSPNLGNRSGMPAHNLRTVLQLMSFRGHGTAPTTEQYNLRDALAVLAAYRTNVEPPGRSLFLRFHHDQDVSQQVVANGAFFGRAAVGGYGRTVTRATVQPGYNTAAWGRFQPGLVGLNVDWLPFVRVDELINFFAAITRQEYLHNTLRVDQHGIGHANPVRSMYVRDRDRSGLPVQDGGAADQPHYSAVSWTNLRRGFDSTPPRIETWGERLKTNGYVDNDAMREIGALRLMAAFSYMHMQYKWSARLSSERSDPIALIAPLGTDPASQMRKPVDPRQILPSPFTAGQFSMRPEDGAPAAARYTAAARFRDGTGDNWAEVAPSAAGLQFKVIDAPSMTGSGVGRDVFRHSRINFNVLSNIVESTRAVSDEAIRRMREGMKIGAVNPTTGAYKIAAYNYMTPAQMIQAALAAGKSGYFTPPPASAGGGGGVLLIGAAALAALLFLK